MFGRKKNNHYSSYSNEPGGLRRRFHHFLLRQRRTSGSLPKQVRHTLPSLKKNQRIAHATRSAVKRTFALLLGFVIIFSAIYLILISDFFTIKEIKTEKNGNSVSARELTPFFDELKGKRLFFANTDKLAQDVEQAFRNKILFVGIKKSYPNRLIVKINEYPVVLTLHNISPEKDQYLVLNQIGYVISGKNEYKEIPVLTVKTSKALKDNGVIAPEQTLATISGAWKKYTELFGMKITGAEWKKVERELHLVTEKDFVIWLDLTNDIEVQLAKLKRALPKLDIYKEPLEYIDLRIAGADNEKVIFRRK